MFTLIDILRDVAKLKAIEISKLLGVSKQAVSSWYAGTRQPHPQVMHRLQRLLDAVSAAVDAGELPVPTVVEHSERWGYVNRTIVKHLTALHQARVGG
jgi:predicted transcriptional regulator